MIKTYGSTENMENIPISMSSLKCRPKSSAWWLTYPSEKYESVQASWDDYIPKIWKNHPFMFQSPPTSHTFPPSAFLSRHQISWGSPPWPPFGASTWSNHGNMDPINKKPSHVSIYTSTMDPMGTMVRKYVLMIF